MIPGVKILDLCPVELVSEKIDYIILEELTTPIVTAENIVLILEFESLKKKNSAATNVAMMDEI